ncbi:MAG TPA: hypothetical protein VFQ76_10530 [Longimicrobiaceae bacterium]|nr:hypothetical protein [Longimicrobiaceae bacterium]
MTRAGPPRATIAGAALRALPLLVGGLALAGCAAVGASSPPAAGCRPPGRGAYSGPLPDLAGEYRLVFVGTRGAGRGRSAEGTLSLHRRPPGQRAAGPLGTTVDLSAVQPFHGSAEIDLRSLGAAFEGELGSRDPSRPGVVVEFDDDPGDAALRLGLGSESNALDVVVADGGSTEAVVRRVGPDGFAGAWESSLSYSDRRSAGYFCAIRVEPAPA